MPKEHFLVHLDDGSVWEVEAARMEYPVGAVVALSDEGELARWPIHAVKAIIRSNQTSMTGSVRLHSKPRNPCLA